MPSAPVIAQLSVEGVIIDAEPYIDEIKLLEQDDKVKGVILQVNSPGGVVTPTYELYQALVRLAEKKPLYVSMSSVATSGGYWISLAGKRIFANPTTITGSVGVLAETLVLEELLNNLGIDPVILKSGRSKDMGTIFRPMTAGEQAYLEEMLQDIHQIFIDTVLSTRNLDASNLDNLLDGRTFTGQQAKSFGLVDELSDYHGVLMAMREDLDLPQAKEYKVNMKQEEGLISILLGGSLSKLKAAFFEQLLNFTPNNFWALQPKP